MSTSGVRIGTCNPPLLAIRTHRGSLAHQPPHLYSQSMGLADRLTMARCKSVVGQSAHLILDRIRSSKYQHMDRFVLASAPALAAFLAIPDLKLKQAFTVGEPQPLTAARLLAVASIYPYEWCLANADLSHEFLAGWIKKLGGDNALVVAVCEQVDNLSQDNRSGANLQFAELVSREMCAGRVDTSHLFAGGIAWGSLMSGAAKLAVQA